MMTKHLYLRDLPSRVLPARKVNRRVPKLCRYLRPARIEAHLATSSVSNARLQRRSSTTSS